jgi:hypothetical protein
MKRKKDVRNKIHKNKIDLSYRSGHTYTVAQYIREVDRDRDVLVKLSNIVIDSYQVLILTLFSSFFPSAIHINNNANNAEHTKIRQKCSCQKHRQMFKNPRKLFALKLRSPIFFVSSPFVVLP